MSTRSLTLCYLLFILSPASTKRFGGGSVGKIGGSGYPPSRGYSGTTRISGSHTYPRSTGLSGHGPSRPRTVVHNHYTYNTPQQIHYPGYGSAPHPVYHGQPPLYVYQYRDSGSRFDNLLTGLALYNLGRMSANHHHEYDNHRPHGEVCKLGIKKENGDYEETRVECRIMTSFIYEAEVDKDKYVVKTNLIETEELNSTTDDNVRVKDALQVKGPTIEVTPKMQCYMIRVAAASSMKKTVPCGLLQAYAESLMRYSNSVRVGTKANLMLIVTMCYLFLGQ